MSMRHVMQIKVKRSVVGCRRYATMHAIRHGSQHMVLNADGSICHVMSGALNANAIEQAKLPMGEIPTTIASQYDESIAMSVCRSVDQPMALSAGRSQNRMFGG